MNSSLQFQPFYNDISELELWEKQPLIRILNNHFSEACKWLFHSKIDLPCVLFLTYEIGNGKVA